MRRLLAWCGWGGVHRQGRRGRRFEVGTEGGLGRTKWIGRGLTYAFEASTALKKKKKKKAKRGP